MSLTASRCTNGHLYYPDHPRCPTCGTAESEPIDLTERSGTVVTWTESTATPPGVRQPNALAIVEFVVEEDTVRVIGQLTTADVDTGDTVEPVYVDELRDPDAGIREAESQEWDGYRFEPVD
ncbi:OB-fold domain and Zn-ribbon containing protein,possible acyl-CoA-binding protein [Halanaeroarchaeum sp. HSR-CO]|uniref:Zn-ribbon domain-containing OB-fold protein n=1 Tax=Halanaeroarchaeum sp. HSR-CO TaxID=2866382 RepID=UPI00217D0F15|nr:nucleic acid-binding protein [Halanaeroarchaeum sp. HSR-CO]UWG48006.1 OB-fold domain and Zn-ribbon containing protein,possible acyl-CoA-binding protein [Halanaeroarchaeum sp. HSR-CO]